jgi:hypothetical protein
VRQRHQNASENSLRHLEPAPVHVRLSEAHLQHELDEPRVVTCRNNAAEVA